MGRAPCCDKNGLKKGPWTPEEDQKLIDYIHSHGPGNWRAIPKIAGLQRCGKSCRLRWSNYLRPDIKRGRFSFEEEETILQLHSILGNKWSAIAARLPGRTDNEIKNYWNTHIRKRLIRSGIDPVTHTRCLDLSSLLNAAFCTPSLLNLPNLVGTQAALLNPEFLRLASILSSLKQENSDQTVLQKLQQNLLQLLQANQLQTPLPQDISTTSSTPCTPFSNQPPAAQAEIDIDINNGFSSEDNIMANFGFQNSREGLASQPGYVPATYNLDSSTYLPPLSESFYFDSLLSTPISSPTPLNSSSTLINSSSSTEDERESNCSIYFKFELPESFNIEDFM